MEFNIEDVVEYIRSHVSEEVSARYTDDEIIDVIDAIIDYDIDNGILDICADFDDEILDEDIDLDGLVKYVEKRLNQGRAAKFSYDDLTLIVKTELEYEDSCFD